METEGGMDGAGPAEKVRNIRLVLAYDGTPYLGWQVQPQGPTVQAALQEALGRITGEATTVKGSGRTDAGVHALGQVANFHTRSRMPPAAFVAALNSLLPRQIAALAADEVPPEFDAQYSAIEKTYRYRVFNSGQPLPFEHLRSWHVPAAIDEKSIEEAASILLGTHDFSAFRSSGCVASSPLRDMRRVTVARKSRVITLEFTADGFLRHMVRNIVGTLVDVGRGRYSPADIAGILHSRDRRLAGVCAPPHGLYLLGVTYPARDSEPRSLDKRTRNKNNSHFDGVGT